MKNLYGIILNENNYSHDILGKEPLEYIEETLSMTGIKKENISLIKKTIRPKTLAELNIESKIHSDLDKVVIISDLCPLIKHGDVKNYYELHKEKGNKVSIVTNKNGEILLIYCEANILCEEKLKSKTLFEIFTNVNLLNDICMNLNYICIEEDLFYVDDPYALTKAINLIKSSINYKHMNNGVILLDPATIYISSEVIIGKGTIIEQMTKIRGTTEIGEKCVIGSFSNITDTEIGNNTEILSSTITSSIIGNECNIGPYAYIRPNSKIGNFVKIGDFVEIKNATIADGTKASHLTYIGDSEVGENVNFGCGTVTVNYDGTHKNKTIIKDNAFIGCNTNLIAPVTVGENAYTAAGSTITKDVPEGNISFARARQENKVKKDK